jgi:streptogramin lyase
LLDLIEYNGYLWVTSHTDHLLIRVDPATGDIRRYPMPGKAGGLVVAGGDLWLTLYHPGALVRLDTGADLIEAGEIVADDWNRFPHRMLCTRTTARAARP